MGGRGTRQLRLWECANGPGLAAPQSRWGSTNVAPGKSTGPEQRRRKSDPMIAAGPGRNHARSSRSTNPPFRRAQSVSVPTGGTEKVPPGPGCSGRRVARSGPPAPPPPPPSSGSDSRLLSPGPSCRAQPGPGTDPCGRGHAWLAAAPPSPQVASPLSQAVSDGWVGCISPYYIAAPALRGGVGNAEPAGLPVPDVKVGGEEGTAGEEIAAGVGGGEAGLSAGRAGWLSRPFPPGAPLAHFQPPPLPKTQVQSEWKQEPRACAECQLLTSLQREGFQVKGRDFQAGCNLARTFSFGRKAANWAGRFFRMIKIVPFG